MENLKRLGVVLLFGLSCFTYGVYTTSTVKFGVPIEGYRWAMTGAVGLMWLGLTYGYIYTSKK